MRRYTIILYPELENGGYSVVVRSLPGCYAQGETIDEAIANAKEAVALHIEGLTEEGEPIPEESEHPLAIVVEVPEKAA